MKHPVAGSEFDPRDGFLNIKRSTISADPASRIVSISRNAIGKAVPN